MPKDKSNHIPKEKQIDISKMKPKEQAMALLIQANPDASKAEIARKAKQAGLFKHEGSGRALFRKGKPVAEYKRLIDDYILSDVLAPAVRIHADKLDYIEGKDIEQVNEVDMRTVYEAEKLRPQTLEVTVPEVIKVAHIHKVIGDITKTWATGDDDQG